MEKKTCKNCENWGGFVKDSDKVYLCKSVNIIFTNPNDTCKRFVEKEKPKQKTIEQKTIDFMLDYLPDVKKIIHNYPATVLIFKDGSKSVVKCEQEHDLEKAILYSWIKHHKKSKKNDWFIEMWKRKALETLSRPSIFKKSGYLPLQKADIHSRETVWSDEVSLPVKGIRIEIPYAQYNYYR